MGEFRPVGERIITPKGITISGDIGHLLYRNSNMSLEEIAGEVKNWTDRMPEPTKYVSEILDDYIDTGLIVKNEETGMYGMTNLGGLMLQSGYW